jgi:acyl-CoA synthetase (AMP-forming)/AMP-acid ligase II
MLDRNAWQYPEHTAFVWGDRRVTHAEHHATASRLAHALAALGLRRQDRVGILSQNNLEFQEVYSACEMTGMICATVNWRLAVPEMVYIINDGAPRVLIFEAAYAEAVQAMRAQLTSVKHYICIGGAGVPGLEFASDYHALVASGDPGGAPFRARAQDVAFLIYTSGRRDAPRASCCPTRAWSPPPRSSARTCATRPPTGC